MEDLSVYLKRNLQELYKKRPDNFGSVQDRLGTMKEKRKNNRLHLLQEKRKISKNLTPIVTPTQKNKKSEVKKEQSQQVPKKNSRLELLAQWKADKEKKKEEMKKKAKPLFKVSHIPVSVGLPDLENVNKEIKGKIFKSKFAPPDYKFKPPANVKAIQFTNRQNETVKEVPSAKSKLITKTKSVPIISTHAMTTRSRILSTKVGGREGPQLQKEKKSSTKKVVKATKMESKSEDNEVKTPERSGPPIYVSPFVTMSRGKDKARSEYSARKKGQSFALTPGSPDYTSPKAGAAYFTYRLDKEIARLRKLCSDWEKCKATEDLPEEALSMIDVTLGQTNLLITKKFEQFRGLIKKCENEESVTCEDLHGFWDMIYIQVGNLDKRFENLNNMKANNWREILPEVKKTVGTKKKIIKSAKASNALKEAIRAARYKKQEESQSNNNKNNKTPKNRPSYLRQSKSRNSSPGLMMMKIAQYAKEVDTPAKSILKTDLNKSAAKNQLKTVLFKDDVGSEDNENDINRTNVEIDKTPTRRSRSSRV